MKMLRQLPQRAFGADASRRRAGYGTSSLPKGTVAI